MFVAGDGGEGQEERGVGIEVLDGHRHLIDLTKLIHGVAKTIS